ncbi:hypothetical protein VPH35_052807 [Triticum aestivum]
MVSWSEPSDCSDSSSDDVSRVPAKMESTDWSGIALNHPARCEHRAPCEKFVAFEWTDSGRRILGCAKKDVPKCNFVDWIDPEWPVQLKQALNTIWTMYEDDTTNRLRQNVLNAEEVVKVMEDKRKMEHDLRFFKVDFAKMVADKEDAITQLGNARLVISDLQEQIEKKNLADKSDTNIHQVLRLKAEKERDQEKEEKVKLVQEMGKIKQERSMLLEEKEKWKQEKRHLEYTIGDLFNEKEATKGKIRKIKEIVDE